MQVITSTKNSAVVEVCKLKEKKYRYQTLQYIIEGEKMIKEAILLNKQFDVIYSTTMEDYLQGQNVCLVAESVMAKMSDTVTSQGVLGVISMPNHTLGDFSRCVILDNIQDAGNLGTIIRTMAAVGVEYLFLNNCVDVYNPKTIRSSMSGIHYIKCFSMLENEIVLLMQDRQIPILIADMDGQDIFTYECDKFALIVGNEAHGVCEGFKRASDKCISLKMKNIESLNAGVAASVILYKLTN